MNESPNGSTASYDAVKSASKRANGSLIVSMAALLVSIISAYFSYLNAATASNALHLSEVDRERTERAYLSADNERLLRLKAGHTIKWAFEVHNMGHTPALRARFVARWRIRADEAPPVPIDNAFKKWREDTEASSINERYSRSFFAIVPLTKRQYSLLQSGTDKLELTAAVRYIDVFGKIHITRICAVYGKFASGEWDSGRCKTGNDAD